MNIKRITAGFNGLAGFAKNMRVMMITLGTGLAVIILGMVFKSFSVITPDQIDGIPILGKLYEVGSENGLTLYLSQLSFTFITISVMSVLSDSSVVIYWENIVKKKLIEPEWSCFYSYTTYSFATVLFGGIAALIGLPLVFIIFFVIDIFVLIALTYSMIDVYFRHDDKAQKLENEFLALVTVKDAPSDVLKRNYDKYLKITGKLRTNTILALKNYDTPTVEENFKFYARNAAYIPEHDFETIMKCVDEINISDFTEWFDYYASISYSDGEMPDYSAQFYVENIMCRGKDLFSIIFNVHILPLFAKYSDSVSTERIFWAYKAYMKKQRNILKKTLKDRYDRKTDGPAASYSRYLLLRALVEVAKNGDKDFLMSFLHSFEETNILSNYDHDESDVYVWEDYFKNIPEEKAEDILSDIYPITEILYGTNRPECVEKAAANVWGDLHGIFIGYEKDDAFSELETDEYFEGEELVNVWEGEELVNVWEGEEPEETEDGSEDGSEDGTPEDGSEDGSEESDDDYLKSYCKIYGQEYMGWPPENDNYGFFTYAGRDAYFISSEHGEMQDGDLPLDQAED